MFQAVLEHQVKDRLCFFISGSVVVIRSWGDKGHKPLTLYMHGSVYLGLR